MRTVETITILYSIDESANISWLNVILNDQTIDSYNSFYSKAWYHIFDSQRVECFSQWKNNVDLKGVHSKGAVEISDSGRLGPSSVSWDNACSSISNSDSKEHFSSSLSVILDSDCRLECDSTYTSSTVTRSWSQPSMIGLCCSVTVVSSSTLTLASSSTGGQGNPRSWELTSRQYS